MAYGPYKEIRVEVSDQILILTLNRPEKLNAFTGTMMTELVDVFTRVNGDDHVRVVIVTGAGRAFCAGSDLSFGEHSFDNGRNPQGAGRDAGHSEVVDFADERVRDGGGNVALSIFECLKPVIAAINGAAIGFGATVQLPMDIRIASTSARFGFVFSRRGIVPESASAWFLPKIVGVARALEWCISGRIFDSQEALGSGLVSKVVDSSELLAEAVKMGAAIRDHTAPVAVALTRQMLWRLSSQDHPIEAHRIDSRGIYARARSADVREGVLSFLEQRLPRFPETVSTDMPRYFPWWEERPYY